MNKKLGLVLLGLMLVLLALPATMLASGPDGEGASGPQTGVISPKKSTYGKTYSEWSAEWQKWQLSIPVSTNPSYDTTGANCKVSQTSQVFFLAGSGTGDPVTRNCKVPAKKPLLIPLITVECSDVEAPPFYGKSGKDRAQCASDIMDGLGPDTLKATIDGRDVTNPARFRFASPKYKFTMPAQDNVLGLDGVTGGRSNSDGYFLMLEPLSAGTHTVHWEAAFTSGVGAGYSQVVTYTLTVGK